MSDSRLRDLEKAAEAGTVGAREALQAERLRLGVKVFERAKAQLRVGHFVVGQRAVDEFPDVVQALLATVLVVDAAFRYEHRGIRYTAFSPEFAPHQQGFDAPTYGLHEDYLETDGTSRLVRLRFAPSPGEAMRRDVPSLDEFPRSDPVDLATQRARNYGPISIESTPR